MGCKCAQASFDDPRSHESDTDTPHEENPHCVTVSCFENQSVVNNSSVYNGCSCHGNLYVQVQNSRISHVEIDGEERSVDYSEMDISGSEWSDNGRHTPRFQVSEHEETLPYLQSEENVSGNSENADTVSSSVSSSSSISEESSEVSSSISSSSSISEESSEDRQSPEEGESHGQQQNLPRARDLGIITSRPKIKRYRMREKRLLSFQGWPDSIPIKKEDLAAAGFFYKGTADCATCFYCGGTLRGWEPGDDPRVEHCRFFPRCEFLHLIVGIDFVQAVQTLHEGGQMEISYQDVLTMLGPSFEEKFHLSDHQQMYQSDSSFTQKDEPDASGSHSSYEPDASISHSSDYYQSSSLETDEKLREIRHKTDSLRMQTTCKVCLENPIEVVFLICGHFVCCVDCACALDSCPICRVEIKAAVRANLRV